MEIKEKRKEWERSSGKWNEKEKKENDKKKVRQEEVVFLIPDELQAKLFFFFFFFFFLHIFFQELPQGEVISLRKNTQEQIPVSFMNTRRSAWSWYLQRNIL